MHLFLCCMSHVYRARGEPCEKRIAAEYHIHFPAPHNVWVTALHRDLQYTANHNTIPGPYSERKENKAEGDINTSRLSHCWNTLEDGR